MAKNKKVEIVKDIPEAKPKVEVVDFYNDIFTTTQYPITKASLDRIGQNWVLDAQNNPDTINEMDYIIRCGIHPNTSMRWIDKYDYFKDYYETVMHIIGLKRERRMTEANPSKLDFTLPQYLKIYKNESERRSNLKKQEQGDHKTHVTVIIPDMEKKDEKDC